MEDNKAQEGEIKEAQVKEPTAASSDTTDATTLLSSDSDDNSELVLSRKGRADFFIELALFLILGVLLGIAAKTEAAKKITIGYNDYQMRIMKSDFNLNKLQADLAAEEAEAELEQLEQPEATEGTPESTIENNSAQENK